MNQTVTFEQMIDWLDGRAPLDTEQLETADHADMNWLQSFHQLSQQVSLDVPPTAVRQNLRHQFAQYAQAKQKPTLFQRLVAVLSFDSFAQPTVAGVRAAASGDTRQLVYNTRAADIAINTQRQNEQVNLAGQVFLLRELPDPILSVQLWRDRNAIGLTTTNDLGEFAFQDLAPGSFEVIISGDTFEIIIPLTM
jgi:hypothetical protein